MTISVCVAGLIADGRISKGSAAEAEKLYNRQFHALKHTMGMSAAASEASERTIRALEAAHLQKKRVTLLQAKSQMDWLERMGAHRDAKGAILPRAAQDEIVAMDKHRIAVRGQAMGMMSGILAKHRRNLIGEVRAKSDLNDLVDELHGRDSGSVNAKELAEAWTRTAEWLRSRFNAAGGRIAKLEGWALPQLHDARRIRDAGYPAWRDATVPLLDRSKMIDWDTGLPLADDTLDTLMQDMWQAIATDGWSRQEPGGIHGGSVANRNSEHRVLHFAGPDEWRAYAARFGGSATPFDAMLAHVERMSRDIAAMERMGPNPESTLRFQGDWLEKSAAESLDQKAIDKGFAGRRQLERLYGEFSGGSHRPESRKLALGFSILRSQQTAAKLGGAALSAVADYGTMIHAAGFNGLPVMGTMRRYLSLMNPANLGDREMAARLGLVSEEWVNLAGAQWRYTGEELTHEVSRRLAEGVLRASGLSLHTEAARMGFGLETLANLVQLRTHDWSAIDPAFRGMLERYGFDAARWDKLRQTPTRTERGTDWFFPEDIAKGPAGPQAADDLLRMIQTELDYAVVTPDLRTRALINSTLPRGTWVGELGRSLFLFKGFPISMLNLYGRRMMELPGTGAKWRYGLTMLALTTTMGALGLQLKELAKGRDPQQMDNRRFMAAALLQGGGLGIFGDLIGSSTDRFGGGLGRTLLGPAAQTLENVGRLTIGNAKAALDGDPETQTTVAKDLVKTVEPEVPGLSLWYVRLGYSRLLGDLIHEWSDPNYADAYARARDYAHQQDTAYWAGPGALTGAGAPMRAPNLGNAIGGEKARPDL
ncbi:hypothetical protein [Novosphingobium sp. UBA1939]|uniref:hypothetical protein n=1 Tax=Novosphingobium sp. UBA1939 TaxID=1946982 RepID=UPI0025E698E7|nr:hypothetical protein [Novosphingobium sp. UBA1939]